MKRLLMVVVVVTVFGVGNAMAQNYAVTIDGTKPFVSEATIQVGGLITFDIYLENAPGVANSGGVWVDFKNFADKISYVSAGRALTDGSEGVTGPWDPAAGGIVNEPLGLPGQLQIIVAQPAGASPDGDGDIIVARVTLQCTFWGNANIRLRTIPGFPTWGPPANGWDDDTINAATLNPTLVVHQEDICEGDLDFDLDVDGADLTTFLEDFGRGSYNSPCLSTVTTIPPDECPSGLIDCGGGCIDPLKDRDYCGATEGCLDGIVCVDGEICADGTCTVSCQSGLTNCSGICLDTDTDENYCGSCTNSCASGEMCIDGVCDVPSLTCDGTLSPLGRWCDQGDGTVKDMTNGLVWLKDAGWGGQKPWADCNTWDDAHTRAGTLYAGMSGAGLSDGSVDGDWRLPTQSELLGITDSTGDEYIRYNQMYYFTNVQQDAYWSSSTDAINTTRAWERHMAGGGGVIFKNISLYVWPVRGGQ